MRKTLGVIVLVLATIGCATNPYTQFFTPVRHAAVSGAPRTPTEIFNGRDVDQDFAALASDGWVLLGYSSFNGKLGSRSQLVEQAQQLGAGRVVMYSKYTNTIAGATPLVLPAPPQTTTTTSQGSVYGAGGSATYSGTSTTTASGGVNVYNIPYRQDRFDQLAVFWVKNPNPPILGVIMRDLSTEERQRLGRNRGQLVRVVRNASPAYRADILIGDVIIRIGDSEISDEQSLRDATVRYAGSEVEVQILRGGETITKIVRLNPASP